MTDEPLPLPVDAQTAAGDKRERALAAIVAPEDKVVDRDAANGQHSTVEAKAELARPQMKRFGPPANAPREAPKSRKRKSRWETAEPKSYSKALTLQSQHLWPTDVTLPGGITVRSALTCSCMHSCL